MENSNRKYSYVIGIDFGHGETSAAVCALDWDTPVDQLEAAKDLEMGGNMKVIPSAITILENGEAKIGDSAFNPDVLKQAKVNICFKKAPKSIDGEKEKIMMRYMKEVYNRIRENNTGMLTEGNHLVYIATPSGWDKGTQQLYVQMARKAGLPVPENGVTKESRAAFVRAQHDSTSGLSKNVENGAIVFDMGSSTLDFTYMNRTLPNLIDNGYDCGASQVEKAIFAQNEAENEAIRRFEEKYPDLRDYLLFEARKVKEKVYFDPTLKVKKTIVFEDFIDDEEFEDERYKLSFQPGELDEFLKSNGYVQQIEDAMRDYRSRFIPNQNIYGVFLTGGASRMDFIKELVSKCWGVPYEMIYRDQDPSLTISQGVAEVARMDLRTESMDSTLEQDISALQNSSKIYDSFVDCFGGNLYQQITGEVADVINKFGSSSYDSSIDALESDISRKVSTVVQRESSRAEEFMQAAIEEATQPITEKIKDIIRHYSQQGINLPVSVDSISVPQIHGIEFNGVINEISTTISNQSINWGSVIAEGAAGFALGWLLGPLGIGAAILIGLFSGNKSEAQQKAEARRKSLNAEQRSQVVNGISEKWDGITSDIANSIRNALTNNADIKRSIDSATTRLLAGYKENLKKARLLID